MTYEEILKGLQEAGVEERDSMMSDSAFLAAKAGREEFMDGYEQLATTAVVNSGEFEFTEIGTACNIDRLRSQLIAQSKSYKIETYSNDSKDTLTLDHISVLSTQVPTSMKYVGDEVRIINKGKTILLGRTTDGEVAYMSVSKVKDLRLSQKQPIKLYMETISPVAISPGQLRSLITL